MLSLSWESLGDALRIDLKLRFPSIAGMAIRLIDVVTTAGAGAVSIEFSELLTITTILIYLLLIDLCKNLQKEMAIFSYLEPFGYDIWYLLMDADVRFLLIFNWWRMPEKISGSDWW
jgi:hypothetical protein